MNRTVRLSGLTIVLALLVCNDASAQVSWTPVFNGFGGTGAPPDVVAAAQGAIDDLQDAIDNDTLWGSDPLYYYDATGTSGSVSCLIIVHINVDDGFLDVKWFITLSPTNILKGRALYEGDPVPPNGTETWVLTDVEGISTIWTGSTDVTY